MTKPIQSDIEKAREIVKNYIEVNMKSSIKEEPDFWYEMPLIISKALANQREESIRVLENIRFKFENEGNKAEPHFIAMVEEAIRKASQ